MYYNRSFTPVNAKTAQKISSTRLAAKLGKAGFDPDRLEQLERADLLEAMVETMLAEPSAESETDFIREAREASQVTLFAGDTSSATSENGSAAVRLRELELQEKRAEREEHQRQAKKEKSERLLERQKKRRLLVRQRQKNESRTERTKNGSGGRGKEGAAGRKTTETGGDGFPGSDRTRCPVESRADQVKPRNQSGKAKGSSSRAR